MLTPVDPSSGSLSVVQKPSKQNIVQLPDVLLVAIFQFLLDRKGQTLVQLSLVNHKFQQLQAQGHLWRNLCLNHFSVKYRPYVISKAVSVLPENVTAEVLGRFWKKLHCSLMSRDYSRENRLQMPGPFTFLDAETLVCDRSKGQIEILDLDGSMPVVFLSEKFTGPAGEFKLARLSDGEIVSVHSDGTLRVWDLKAPGKPTMKLQTGQSRAYSLASLPNKRIAAAYKGRIGVFDLQNPKEAPIILEDGADRICRLQVLPDGRLVLGDEYSNSRLPIRIWDPDASDKSCIKLNMTRGCSYCLTTLPNGQIVSGELASDGVIALWDPNVPDAPIATTTEFPPKVLCFTALPNGFIASGHSCGSLCIWDLETSHKPLTIFKSHEGPIYKLETLPDGRLLAEGGGDMLYVLGDSLKSLMKSPPRRSRPLSPSSSLFSMSSFI